jgi:hypothetical protein
MKCASSSWCRSCAPIITARARARAFALIIAPM